MKRKLVSFLLLFVCAVLSGCSGDVYKGPLIRKTLYYQTYAQAIDGWAKMNELKDEGFCLSFDFQMVEYNLRQVNYYLSGIDVSSRFTKDDGTTILSRRGFYVHYSSDFSIYFSLKNWEKKTDGFNFEWKLYSQKIDEKIVFNPEIQQKVQNWYNSGYYEGVSGWDVEYCLVNNYDDLGIIVSFRNDDSIDLFNKYQPLIKEKFLEELNDKHH